MGPIMVPRYSCTLVLEGLLVRLLTCFEGAPSSLLGVPPTLSVIPLFMLVSEYGNPRSGVHPLSVILPQTGSKLVGLVMPPTPQ